jgi:hypothetical protein
MIKTAEYIFQSSCQKGSQPTTRHKKPRRAWSQRKRWRTSRRDKHHATEVLFLTTERNSEDGQNQRQQQFGEDVFILPPFFLKKEILSATLVYQIGVIRQYEQCVSGFLCATDNKSSQVVRIGKMRRGVLLRKIEIFFGIFREGAFRQGRVCAVFATTATSEGRTLTTWRLRRPHAPCDTTCAKRIRSVWIS